MAYYLLILFSANAEGEASLVEIPLIKGQNIVVF